MYVQPYDWTAEDVGTDEDAQFVIHCWALTPGDDSKTVLLRIEDYKPFCTLELPPSISSNSNKIKSLDIFIKHCLKYNAPIESNYNGYKTLYGYQTNLTAFLTYRFNSLGALRHCCNLIRKERNIPNVGNNIACKVHQSSIPHIHKMLTEMDIRYAKWLKVNLVPVEEEEKIANCPEYIVSYKDLVCADEEMCKTLYSSPITIGFDIEAYSDNHLAFPNANFVTDAVYQISVIVGRYGQPENRKRILLTTADTNEIQDAEIRLFETETQLIHGFCDSILEYHPAILTGYNIYKFDIGYMNNRLKLYNSSWKSMGLLKGKQTTIFEKSFETAAYGAQIFTNLVIDGTVCLDMLPVIKRDWSMNSYKLDVVAMKFLGKNKNPVTVLQMFQAYKLHLDSQEDSSLIEKSKATQAEVGEYCLQDSVLCLDLIEKLNVWVILTEQANVVDVAPTDIFSSGQTVRVRNQAYRYSYREGIIIDSRQIAENSDYKGASVIDPVPGLYNYISVLDFNSLYPSIIIAYNICYTTLLPEDSPIPYEYTNNIPIQEGDKVYHHRYIKKEIYEGILPRLCRNLISERNKIRKSMGPHNDTLWNNILNQRQLGLKITANSIYGSLGVAKGGLPLIEAARSVTSVGRNIILQTADFVKTEYGGVVVYGDTDSVMVDFGISDPYKIEEFSKRVEREISALFPEAINIQLEDPYSSALFLKKKRYVGIPLRSMKLDSTTTIQLDSFNEEWDTHQNNLWKVSNSTETKWFSVPKSVVPHKDRISGTELNEGGVPDIQRMTIKGLMAVRRDNCPWAKKAYSRALMNIVFGRSLESTLTILDEEILSIMNGSVQIKDLVVTVQIAGSYSSKSSYPVKIFLDEMKRVGIDIKPGERIEYIFVETLPREDQSTNQGYKMKLLEYFDPKSNFIDKIFYINKYLAKPIQQILYLAYRKQFESIPARYIKRKRGYKHTYLSEKYVDSWTLIIERKNSMLKELLSR